MACECVENKETAEAFMAKQTKKTSSVIDDLTAALAKLDKEQDKAKDEAHSVNIRQSKAKLKALIKFIDARI